MKNVSRLVLLVLALTAVVTSAEATTLSVWWTSTQNFSNVQIVGYGTRNFGLGVATGIENYGTGSARNLGQVWCVDLLNYSGDTWSVTRHTDGTSWSSNSPYFAGEDDYRIGDWTKVAWLANGIGSGLAGHVDKSIAFNCALYYWAYGSNLVESSMTDDLSATQLSYYTGYRDAAIGQSSTNIEWFDNDASGGYYQDFVNDVPEPSSLLLVGSVLTAGALGLWRRRR